MDEYKNRTQNKILDVSTCLILSLLLTIALFFNNAGASTTLHEISEVFIEDSGNNKYEAQIKAHEKGMRRALLLIADKLKIPTQGVLPIPYNELKEVFSLVNIASEIHLLDKYKATVTYSYELGKVYSLLLKYGDLKINNIFEEALILPVLKQQDSLVILGNDQKWGAVWNGSREILDNYKLYYPEKTLYLSNKITPNNLDHLDYEDFVEIFRNKLFKKVVIVTMELFTNRSNGSSWMQIKKYNLLPNHKKEVHVEKYDLKTWQDIPCKVDLTIDRLIDDYGVFRNNKEKNSSSEEGFINVTNKQRRPIVMYHDAFEQKELDTVVSKLETVDQINDFVIEHEKDSKYKILIYTNVDEYELSEGLYLNGLSYKTHGEVRNLIDVKKGG